MKAQSINGSLRQLYLVWNVLISRSSANELHNLKVLMVMDEGPNLVKRILIQE